MSRPYNWHEWRNALGWSALIAVGVGLLWMALTHLAPRMAPMIAIIGAVLFLITIGVLLLVQENGYFLFLFRFWRWGHWLKIVTAIFCFLLAIILIVMIVMYSNEIKFQGLMLDYARRFLNQNPSIFAYIPLYMILTLGLVALILWQQACFTSHFGYKENPMFTGLWGFLNVLEFMWGLQFLRDSCKFQVYFSQFLCFRSSCRMASNWKVLMC